MNLNSSKIMFFTILIISTMITVSSNNWLGMWMGLEINLISFIPLMYKTKNNTTSEAMMIYFIIQSMGSILLLFSILINFSINITPMMNETLQLIMLMSMMIKLGAPPFHQWFPEVMEKLDWWSCTILMTWQKLAPLCIMSNLMSNTQYISIFVSLSVITGAVGGLNQTSIRKIMAYSSINHMGWMIACMSISNKAWMLYLLIYSIMVMILTFTFQELSSFYINQMMMSSNSWGNKILISISLFSIGGLPPFLGFLPKWMVMQYMISSGAYMTLFIMIMSALITLFYYLRLTSTLFLMNFSFFKWKLMGKEKKTTLILMIINLSLPMASIYSFL
uniref:NADH-ubiquinone oxidoreductase chain 2 n=1 Tax=Camarochiloides weiweii TaxID=2785926 RepID=A0A873QI23_9HEMI|nr:NADH dehydrogenase subunit 2 [Camarochiloides weiweii]